MTTDKNKQLHNLMVMSEAKLSICMLKDITNFEVVSNKIKDLVFIDESCRDIMEVMGDMYNKLGYMHIDRVSLLGYFDRVKLDVLKQTSILSVFDMLQGIKQGNKEFDFEGVFEEYSMISSTYKFYSWVVNSGGIEEVANKLLKLKNMSEVNTVIEGRLLEFFNTGTADASVLDTDITASMDDSFITSIENKDAPIESTPLLSQFYLLNRITKGFVRGTTGLGGMTGSGKTSFMYSVFVMSVLENSKSKVCIFCNEQTAKVFTIGMVFAFLSQVFNRDREMYSKVGGQIKLSRDKYISNSFDDSEIKRFVYAIKQFRSRYKGRITHSYFEDMTPNSLRREIRKKVRSGHKYFFYDTFKDPDEDYAKLMKLATVFDQQTKKYPIHAFCSLQLSDESLGTKYLTHKCLASARGTKRVMDTLYLMRKLDTEELATLTVHKLGHPEQTIPINLQGKNYYAIFIDKNRNGTTDVVILFEIYLDILYYKEIGLIQGLPKEDFKKPYVKKK
ncbi:MAG: hypothetical protein ACRCZ0_12090 [Cetobacterium sp.]